MKPFVFRLEKVLRMRRFERDRVGDQLQQIQHAINTLNEKLQEIQSETDTQRSLRAKENEKGQLNVDRLLDRQRYELVLKLQQHQLMGQIEQVQAKYEEVRLQLVEADREVKVLEKLESRQLDEYQREAEREEIRELDEVALRLVAKRRADSNH